jgi:hypothetical protein
MSRRFGEALPFWRRPDLGRHSQGETPVIPHDSRLRKLVGLLYVAGAFLVADQVADLIATIATAPVQLSSAQWRFGVFGLLVTRGSVFLVAEVMLWTAAVVLDHRNVIRSLAVLNLLLAAALAAGLGLFGLDALELRRQVKAGSGPRYDAAAARAILITLCGVVLLAWSGFAGWAATAGRGGRRETAASLLEGRKVKEGPR